METAAALHRAALDSRPRHQPVAAPGRTAEANAEAAPPTRFRSLDIALALGCVSGFATMVLVGLGVV